MDADTYITLVRFLVAFIVAVGMLVLFIKLALDVVTAAI